METSPLNPLPGLPDNAVKPPRVLLPAWFIGHAWMKLMAERLIG